MAWQALASLEKNKSHSVEEARACLGALWEEVRRGCGAVHLLFYMLRLINLYHVFPCNNKREPEKPCVCGLQVKVLVPSLQ